MQDPTGQDWTPDEIDLIVADYFDMRSMAQHSVPFVKSSRNAELQRLTGRSRGSIERKHMNISAVLERLCVPWLRGYAPARNFQHALIDAVERFITERPDVLVDAPDYQGGFAEEVQIFIDAPPERVDEAIRDERLARLVRKFDPAARDDRNRHLGDQGERYVLHAERGRLKAAGKSDLANKVRWVSQEEGDGAGYDIRSFSNDGKEQFLEIKTTLGHNRTPFFISRNEKEFAQENPDRFRLFRLYEFGGAPRAFVLQPPLEEQVWIAAENYKASFG